MRLGTDHNNDDDMMDDYKTNQGSMVLCVNTLPLISLN